MEPSYAEDEAWLKVMEVATLSLVPMALKAAIELNMMGILAEHGGEDGYLTPAQIASHFLTPVDTPLQAAATALDRILRVLASHGLLSSSLHMIPHTEHPVRAYALNSSSRYLLHSNPTQGSLSPFVLLIQDPLVIECFFHFPSSVLHGHVPFDQAHQMQCFSYAQQDARFHDVFIRAMDGHSKLFTQTLLDMYHGFNNITTLVDVGGGIGACLAMITSKYTHIKGINFDLAHVIGSAPQYPGIKHVGGDMFQEIPNADAMFIKLVLHDWSDDQCVTILKNCYKALPNKGKVIVVDFVLPTEVESQIDARVKYQMDLLMLAYIEGGKERTQREWENLSIASGFSKLQLMCNIHGYSVMEIHKDIV